MVDAGLIVLVSFISPFRAERRMARELMDEGEFFEVFVDTPLAVAESARPEGPLQESPARRAQELHRHRFAVRGAGAPGSARSTRRVSRRRASRRDDSRAASACRRHQHHFVGGAGPARQP